MSNIRLGYNSKALECFNKSHDMVQRLNNNQEFRNEYAQTLLYIGITYLTKGKNDDALKYLTKSLDNLNEINNNKDHQDIARAKYHLAICNEKLTHEKESVQLFIEAYEMRMRLFGTTDHLDLVESLQSIAMCHSKLYNYKEAEKFLKKCYEMKLRLNNNSVYHPSISDIINVMAVFYSRFGRDFESLKLKIQSLEIIEKLYGNVDEPVRAQILNNIAVGYARCGDDKNAFNYKLQSFEMRKRLFGSVDLKQPNIIQSIIAIGVTHLRLGQEDIAYNDYFSKINEIKPNLPIGNQSLFHYYLAVYYGIKQDYDGCFQNANEAYKIRLSSYQNKDDIDMAFTLTQLSIYYEKKSDLEKSLKYERESYEMKMRLYSEIKNHPFLAHSLTYLSIIYQNMENYEESIKYENDSCKMKKELFKEEIHPMLADSYLRLSILYSIKNENEQSEKYLTKAQEMRLNLFKKAKTVSYLKVIKTEQDLELNNQSNDYCSRIFNFI